MQMDSGLDTGPVLLQRRLAIARARPGARCTMRSQRSVPRLLLEALAALAAGTQPPSVPQPAAGATYAPKIAKSEARIDWTKDAAHIERQVRAFNPWPVAETQLDGAQLRILEAEKSRKRS